jgi:hypothetical protein
MVQAKYQDILSEYARVSPAELLKDIYSLRANTMKPSSTQKMFNKKAGFHTKYCDLTGFCPNILVVCNQIRTNC